MFDEMGKRYTDTSMSLVGFDVKKKANKEVDETQFIKASINEIAWLIEERNEM